MDQDYLVLYIIAGFFIGVYTMYLIVKAAVKSGSQEQVDLLKKQNDILLKMLNHQGVDKDELTDLFLMNKKDLWPSMKNSKQ